MFPITMSNSASASDDLERQNITDNRSVNLIKLHAFSQKTIFITHFETAKSSSSKFCISTMFSFPPSRSFGFQRKMKLSVNNVTKSTARIVNIRRTDATDMIAIMKLV